MLISLVLMLTSWILAVIITPEISQYLMLLGSIAGTYLATELIQKWVPTLPSGWVTFGVVPLSSIAVMILSQLILPEASPGWLTQVVVNLSVVFFDNLKQIGQGKTFQVAASPWQGKYKSR